jgi:hypothetical protein
LNSGLQSEEKEPSSAAKLRLYTRMFRIRERRTESQHDISRTGRPFWQARSDMTAWKNILKASSGPDL